VDRDVIEIVDVDQSRNIGHEVVEKEWRDMWIGSRYATGGVIIARYVTGVKACSASNNTIKVTNSQLH
jgi:hypothetical protein